jgi:hypothetical protein
LARALPNRQRITDLQRPAGTHNAPCRPMIPIKSGLGSNFDAGSGLGRWPVAATLASLGHLLGRVAWEDNARSPRPAASSPGRQRVVSPSWQGAVLTAPQQVDGVAAA